MVLKNMMMGKIIITLALVTGQIVQIKNAGCLAHAEKLVMDFLKINYSLFSSRVKIFSWEIVRALI